MDPQFRFWDPFNGVMQFSESGKLVQFFHDFYMTRVGGNKPILMQCVGKADITGAGIFEGDVVNVIKTEGEIISPKNVVKLADFLGGHYWIENNGGKARYEIIGNIHSNPELKNDTKN